MDNNDNKEKTINNAELAIDLTEIKIEPEDNPLIVVSKSIPQMEFGKNILSSSQIGSHPKTILVLNKNGETLSADSVISTKIVERNQNLRAKQQILQKPQSLLSIISRTTAKPIQIISSSIASGFSRKIDQTFLTFTSRCIEADGTVKTLKEYLCNFCQYKVSIIYAMERHVLTHKFVCNHCSFISLTRIEIIKHKHDCHSGLSSEELAGYEGLENILSNKSTEIVSSSLSKSSVLSSSTRIQNPIENTRQIIKTGTLVDKNLTPEDGSFFTYKVVQDGAGRIKMYECYICGMRCLTTRDIIKHASMHSITEMTKLGKKGTIDLDVKWECYYCNYSNAAQSEIINHIIKIHPDQRIQIKMINNKTLETNDASSLSTAPSSKYKPSISMENEGNLNFKISSTDSKIVHADDVVFKKNYKLSINSGVLNNVQIDSQSGNLSCSDDLKDSISRELKTDLNYNGVSKLSTKQSGYKSTLEKYMDITVNSSKVSDKIEKSCNLSEENAFSSTDNDVDIESTLETNKSDLINNENIIDKENAITGTHNINLESNKSLSRYEVIKTNREAIKNVSDNTNNDHIDKITETAKKINANEDKMDDSNKDTTTDMKKVTSTEPDEEECLWGCFYCQEQSSHRSKIVSHVKKKHSEEKLVVTRRKITRVPASEMKLKESKIIGDSNCSNSSYLKLISNLNENNIVTTKNLNSLDSSPNVEMGGLSVNQLANDDNLSNENDAKGKQYESELRTKKINNSNLLSITNDLENECTVNHVNNNNTSQKCDLQVVSKLKVANLRKTRSKTSENLDQSEISSSFNNSISGNKALKEILALKNDKGQILRQSSQKRKNKFKNSDYNSPKRKAPKINNVESNKKQTVVETDSKIIISKSELENAIELSTLESLGFTYDKTSNTSMCGDCGFIMSLMDITTMRIHRDNHMAERAWMCAYCEFTTNERILISQHVQQKHILKPIRFLRTFPKFGKEIYVESNLKGPRSALIKRRTNRGLWIWQCPYCYRSSLFKGFLNIHLQVAHADKDQDSELICLRRYDNNEINLSNDKKILNTEAENNINDFETKNSFFSQTININQTECLTQCTENTEAELTTSENVEIIDNVTKDDDNFNTISKLLNNENFNDTNIQCKTHIIESCDRSVEDISSNTDNLISYALNNSLDNVNESNIIITNNNLESMKLQNNSLSCCLPEMKQCETRIFENVTQLDVSDSLSKNKLNTSEKFIIENNDEVEGLFVHKNVTNSSENTNNSDINIDSNSKIALDHENLSELIEETSNSNISKSFKLNSIDTQSISNSNLVCKNISTICHKVNVKLVRAEDMLHYISLGNLLLDNGKSLLNCLDNSGDECEVGRDAADLHRVYKCGYCAFKGYRAIIIRRHLQAVHQSQPCLVFKEKFRDRDWRYGNKSVKNLYFCPSLCCSYWNINNEAIGRHSALMSHNADVTGAGTSSCDSMKLRSSARRSTRISEQPIKKSWKSKNVSGSSLDKSSDLSFEKFDMSIDKPNIYKTENWMEKRFKNVETMYQKGGLNMNSTWNCKYCSLQLDILSMRSHLRIAHPEKNTVVIDTFGMLLHICCKQDCTYTTRSASNLRQHIALLHTTCAYTSINAKHKHLKPSKSQDSKTLLVTKGCRINPNHPPPGAIIKDLSERLLAAKEGMKNISLKFHLKRPNKDDLFKTITIEKSNEGRKPILISKTLDLTIKSSNNSSKKSFTNAINSDTTSDISANCNKLKDNIESESKNSHYTIENSSDLTNSIKISNRLTNDSINNKRSIEFSMNKLTESKIEKPKGERLLINITPAKLGLTKRYKETRSNKISYETVDKPKSHKKKKVIRIKNTKNDKFITTTKKLSNKVLTSKKAKKTNSTKLDLVKKINLKSKNTITSEIKNKDSLDSVSSNPNFSDINGQPSNLIVDTNSSLDTFQEDSQLSSTHTKTFPLVNVKSNNASFRELNNSSKIDSTIIHDNKSDKSRTKINYPDVVPQFNNSNDTPGHGGSSGKRGRKPGPKVVAESNVVTSLKEGFKYTVDGHLAKKRKSKYTEYPFRFECVICDYKIGDLKLIKSHLFASHSNQVDVKFPNCIDRRARELRKRQKIIFCHFVECNFYCKKDEEMESHFKHDCSYGEQLANTPTTTKPTTSFQGNINEENDFLDHDDSTLHFDEDREIASNQNSMHSPRERMFQCSSCSYITTDMHNVRMHVIAEHATMEGGFTEIKTEISSDGNLVMCVNDGGPRWTHPPHSNTETRGAVEDEQKIYMVL